MWHRLLVFCFALFMPVAVFAQNGEPAPFEAVPAVPVSETESAAELIIQSEQIGWNLFRFRPSSRLGAGEFEYEWSFGDGAMSNERVVEHAFPKPGRYSVTLRLIEPDGTPHAASLMVRVGFFHLANWRLWLLIALLALIIILAAVTAGVSESIVPEGSSKPVEKPSEGEAAASSEVSLEPLSEETGNLDALASTGEETEALAGDLALLEAIGKPAAKAEQPTEAASLEPAAVIEEKVKPAVKKPKAKKKTTKKRPSKKRIIKVKEEM